MDEQHKRRKLLEPLKEIILNPSTSDLNLSNEDQSILIETLKRIALSKATNRREKFFLLTTFPLNWSIRKISRTFGVSRRIANAAKHFHDTKGYGVEPCNKKGRPLETKIINKVKEFYLSDEVSRVMPGAKDVKSIVVDGKSQHVTVNKLFRKFILKLFAVSNYEKKTFLFCTEAFAFEKHPRYSPRLFGQKQKHKNLPINIPSPATTPVHFGWS